MSDVIGTVQIGAVQELGGVQVGAVQELGGVQVGAVQELGGVVLPVSGACITSPDGSVPAEGHYYCEVIVDELDIADSCVAHHPLWETSGAQAIDVSGNGNHGTFVSNPTLGQDAVSEGFLSSIGGLTGYLTCATSIDVNGDDFTVAGACDPTTGSARALFHFGSTNNYIVFGVLSGQIRIQGFSGAISFANLGALPGSTFSWAVRRSVNELKVWIDGTVAGSIDLSAITFSSDTTHSLRSMPNNGWAVWNGDFQHRGTFNVAHSDAVCARLSQGTV